MEELSVFVPLERISDFRAGLPVNRSLFNGEVKGIHSEGPEGIFCGRERTVFFQNVKQVYKDATVFFALGLREKTSGPFLARALAKAKTSHNLRGGVRMPNRRPGGRDRCTETIMEGPRWLVAKGATLWNGGRDRGHKRHVVRGVTCERGESGGREKGILGVVDKDSIEPNKGGNLSTTGPGELPVPEGELNEG
jgi:hypothetical protein